MARRKKRSKRHFSRFESARLCVRVDPPWPSQSLDHELQVRALSDAPLRLDSLITYGDAYEAALFS